MAVSINIGTNAQSVGLTCGSANTSARQRRPTNQCVKVVVICYSASEMPARPRGSWGGQGLGLRQTADCRFENPHLPGQLHGYASKSATVKRRLFDCFQKTQSRNFRRQ